jgi:hypothetical protein
MYRCERCHQVTPPRTRAHRWITESRPFNHPVRPLVFWHLERKGKTRWVEADDPGGRGTAIVREITVCPDCYAELTATSVERASQPRQDNLQLGLLPTREPHRQEQIPRRPHRRPKGLLPHPILAEEPLRLARTA